MSYRPPKVSFISKMPVPQRVRCSDCGCYLNPENVKEINGIPYCKSCGNRILKWRRTE